MIRHLSRMVFVSLFLFSPELLWAAEAGMIKTLRGSVQIERAGQVSEAQVGEHVHGGDRLQVPANASVGISLKDESLLSIGPGSSVILTEFAYNPTTRNGSVAAEILRGTLRFVTGFIGRANPNDVKISTPTATIGVRGTDFIVEVPDGGK